jgi:jasmonate ZIM domain-containing protein
MYLASKGSVPSSTPVARRPEAPMFAPTKMTLPEVSPAKHMVFQNPQHVSPHASSTSKPITAVFQPTSLPRNASSSNVDSTVPKSSSPLAVPPISQAPLAVPPLSQVPSTQPTTLAVTTAAAIMPRGTDALYCLRCIMLLR